SFHRAAREPSRPSLAPTARLLLALLGLVHQHLLAAARAFTTTHVRAVGLHLPRAVIGRQLRIQHGAQLLALRWILHRYDDLHAALEVPLHRIGRSDVPLLLLASVPEEVDAAMLEKAADDAHHPDGLGQARDARPEPARVPHDQVDLHACT